MLVVDGALVDGRSVAEARMEGQGSMDEVVRCSHPLPGRLPTALPSALIPNLPFVPPIEAASSRLVSTSSLWSTPFNAISIREAASASLTAALLASRFASFFDSFFDSFLASAFAAFSVARSAALSALRDLPFAIATSAFSPPLWMAASIAAASAAYRLSASARAEYNLSTFRRSTPRGSDQRPRSPKERERRTGSGTGGALAVALAVPVGGYVAFAEAGAAAPSRWAADFAIL